MTTSTYTGSDELEIMQLAHNYNEDLVRFVASQLPAGSRSELVDFGAGNGYFAGQLSVRTAKIVYCVEPDAKLRDLISARYNLPTFSDLSKLTTTPAIYTLNVLEHIEDDQTVLKNFYEVLEPGGRVVIYVPAFQLLFSSNDVKVGHVRRYSLSELKEKVSNAGFKIIRADYADPIGFFATLAFKVLDRKKDGSINVRALKIFDRWLFPLNKVIEPLTKQWLGKNIKLVAEKPKP